MSEDGGSFNEHTKIFDKKICAEIEAFSDTCSPESV